MCLRLWHRSKEGYRELRQSGFLILPSERLLQYKKNKVPPKPGLNADMLAWMREEANKQCVSDIGRCGAICFDEIKIQVKFLAIFITKNIGTQEMN